MERVDLLVHNANIYTVNADFDQASAFVVKNGKFVAVGGEDLVQSVQPAVPLMLRFSYFPRIY